MPNRHIVATNFVPLQLLGHRPVERVTVLNTVDNCNTMAFV